MELVVVMDKLGRVSVTNFNFISFTHLEGLLDNTFYLKLYCEHQWVIRLQSDYPYRDENRRYLEYLTEASVAGKYAYVDSVVKINMSIRIKNFADLREPISLSVLDFEDCEEAMEIRDYLKTNGYTY